MKNFSTSIIAAALGLAVLGCSKDKTDTPAPSKTDLLTDKNWIISAQTVSPGISSGGTIITDIYGQFQACDKDDFIRFEKPNVFKDDEGATKCLTANPQTTTGTWVFNADQTIITITGQGGNPVSANITELTDTSLKFTFTQTNAGINYTYTLGYRKG
jgi:hypothetical protein